MATFIEVWDLDDEEFVVINVDHVVKLRARYDIDDKQELTVAHWEDTSTTRIGHTVAAVIDLIAKAKK